MSVVIRIVLVYSTLLKRYQRMESIQESSTLKAALNILRRAPPSDTENVCFVSVLSSRIMLYSYASDLSNVFIIVASLEFAKTLVGKPRCTRRTQSACSFSLANCHGRRRRQTFSSLLVESSCGWYIPVSLSSDDSKIQAHANELWKTYKQLYYGNSRCGILRLRQGRV